MRSGHTYIFLSLVTTLMILSPVTAAAPQDCEHDRATISAERGIIFQEATGLSPGDMYWKLVDAAWCDPIEGNGMINIFYKCLDVNGNPIANQECIAEYGTTQYSIFTKAPPDWGDFPMSGGNWCPAWPTGGNGPYNAFVAGAASDKVIGMGLPCNHHESYFLTWQWSQYSSSTEGAISGTVTDAGGSPISGADIVVNPGNHIATTGPTGTYAIQNLTPDTYSVSASKAGYNPETQTNVTVTAGVTTTVDFTLTSSLSGVSGTVTDSADTPIASAFVKITPGNYGTITAADGSYQLEGVSPGTYSFTAVAPTKVTQTKANQVIPSNGTLVVDFSMVDSGTVAHILDDFNGSYSSYPSLEESFQFGIGNQMYWQESLSDRILSPYTGTNSSQGFAVITNNDQYISYFEAENPATGDKWIDLPAMASQNGWEQIDTTEPIYFIVYIKGENFAIDPDDASTYWQQQFSLHYSDQTNYDNDDVFWNSQSNGHWRILKLTGRSLSQSPQQWLTFESWYPPYYAGGLTDTSWMVWENLMVEYTPDSVLAPVTGVSATADPLLIALAWTHSVSSASAGTRIVHRTDRLPTSATDGTVLIDQAGSPGSAGSFVHRPLSPGSSHYYALFAYSASPAYASAVTATADVPGIAPGDFDTDGDVDQDDFGHLQICFSGSVAQTSPACSDALLDGDADVDADDYEIFQGCMSGANVPADLVCGNFQ